VYIPEPPATVTVSFGTVWIATSNQYQPNKQKAYNLTLRGTGVGQLTVESVKAYDSLGGDIDVSWYSVEPAVGALVVTANIEPQPDWEVVKISKPGVATNITFKAQGVCQCASVTDDSGSALSVQSAFATASDTVAITEVWMFPIGTDIDINVTPTFSGPPSSGNWTYSFLTVDPFGITRDKGIKWVSDGVGLQETEGYQMGFSVVGSASRNYWSFGRDENAELAFRHHRGFLRNGPVGPSLSLWGVGALLVLMCATVFFIIRRRISAGRMAG
jgi:hypothetical protein